MGTIKRQEQTKAVSINFSLVWHALRLHVHTIDCDILSMMKDILTTWYGTSTIGTYSAVQCLSTEVW